MALTEGTTKRGPREPQTRFEINADRLIELDRKHKLPGFASLDEHAREGPLVIVRGKGVFVWDARGKQYLDGSSAIWNVNLGYGQSEVAEAVRDQLEQLSFHIGLLNISTPPAIELAAKIASLAPKGLSRVFFTSGGSESNETVIRLSRLYFKLKGYKNKTTAIARIRGYHGSSCGAASLTGIEHFHELFEPMLPKVRHIGPPYCYRCPWKKDYPSCGVVCADELEKVILEEGPDNVAFFIAEPVMGAGGVIPAPPEYFPRIRQICDRYDVLMVVDEVITGTGRTGKMWGIEHWGVTPDIISTAKGISSGYLPLGAVIVHDKIYETLLSSPKGTAIWHGYTNTGNPACCAAGLKVLEIVERDGLIENAAKMGKRLHEGLHKMRSSPIVGDIRGLGLMAAVELVRDKQTREAFPESAAVGAQFRRAALEAGLLIRAIGDSICMSPPLTITASEIDLLLERLTNALAKTEAWARSQKLI
ncbi:MAG: aspartate aminotransferase family protein [Candidatus Binataceae bacterium]|jgi:adenosylmethionine-8-amino-7-oxononanoate aminotransferase